MDNTRPRQVSGKGRPVIEDGVAIQVLAGNDVERRSGIGDHERTDAEAVRQGHVSKEKQAIANVKACTPIVGLNAQRRIRREAAGATSIAVGIAERIKAGQRDPGSHAHIEVGDELVLVENSARLVLILRSRNRIYNARKQLVNSVGMKISSGNRGRLG